MAYNHYNMGGQMSTCMTKFKAKYNDDFYTGSTIRIFETLGAAMAKAKSTDPVKVAAALEGLQVDSFNGEVEIRKADHQLQQPLYVTVWDKAVPKVSLQPRKHRHDAGAAEGVPQLRLQHTDQLPDETSCLISGQASGPDEPERVYRIGLFYLLPMRRSVSNMEFFIISMLNGLSYGLLLFMLGSGLTLIFSMMGVLIFAHASFYMLGAYVGYTIAALPGSCPLWCWLRWSWALWGRCLSGCACAGFTSLATCPELLITFGLFYVVLELVQLIWGPYRAGVSNPLKPCKGLSLP